MTHNVLVVDDEPKLCDLLTQALSQNGIQVFSAGNGLHALKVLGEEDIDLVISDWRRRASGWSTRPRSTPSVYPGGGSTPGCCDGGRFRASRLGSTICSCPG